MQTTAAVLAPNILEHYLVGGPPRLPNVPGGVFPTKDGWVLVTLLQEEKYKEICRVLGVPELATDPRFDSFDSRATNKDILLPLLREAYRKETTAVWVERMKAVDVLCSPVQSPLDWLDDPHVQAVNAAPMITQPGVGTVPVPSIPGAAPCREGDPLYRLPEVGEHTREVLEGMGLSAQDIDALRGSEAAD
jgi:crotonobetainyl-CoA:carnitine CoA-transferase CaiB-like acyl-CoA transferase